MPCCACWSPHTLADPPLIPPPDSSLTESPTARQQLLAGCLRLLGAPVPGSLPSNSVMAAVAAGGCDELWWAAAVAGCCPRLWSSDGAGRASSGWAADLASSGWAADLLSQGDWSWLLGGSASVAPRGLRQRPWYRDGHGFPPRPFMLTQLLTALLRGPCRQDAALAAALLEATYYGNAGSGDDASLLIGRPSVCDGAVELAKQLLAEQRTNLALWQARHRAVRLVVWPDAAGVGCRQCSG